MSSYSSPAFGTLYAQTPERRNGSPGKPQLLIAWASASSESAQLC
jgi:hypothetical protein